MTLFKVIEERMSPSGRVVYLTLPMYHTISEDEINGIVPMKPKDTIVETMLKKWTGDDFVEKQSEEKFIHAFTKYENALEYMSEHFKGYLYTRPVIYQCESEDIEKIVEGIAKCNSIKFVKPVSQMVNFAVMDYVPMQKPEKKKTYGFAYDESEINGDVEQD